jgi:hypothetical protein
MDAITLDGLLAEARPLIVGRHLGRARPGGASALSFELSGARDLRLWIETARGRAGVYLVGRDDARRLEQPDPSARTRHALLHLRKHVDGVRVTGLERVVGERVVVVRTTLPSLVLRVSPPALTLVSDGAALVTLGDGSPAWPLPDARPEREWDRVEAGTLQQALREAGSEARSPARALLAACPGLGATLAQELDGSAESLDRLRARLTAPRPVVLAPAPLERCHDADLARAALALVPLPLERAGRTALVFESWREAAVSFLEAHRRGERFERRRRDEIERARRELRKLTQLSAHLQRDAAELADPAELRRRAEALLIAAPSLGAGRSEVELDDPYQPGSRLRVTLDPALGAVANAERLFARARRVERARAQIKARLAETRSGLEAAREGERRLEEARDLADLGPAPAQRPDVAKGDAARPLRYLTGRGLTLLVGRGARENHHLTFGVARPEDVWLHARDVPGAHVILRDPEARAGADDLREAAEVAAFFSAARAETAADVHATRRKHVRPGGGLGRVHVAHSETLRVAPRDPEGRLRRA